MCQFKTPQKFADKSDVKFAATHLINLHGATTTLEVKNMLRSQCLIAFQDDISRFMEMAAFEQGWECECNGRFRIYSFVKERHSSKNRNVPAFSLN